MTKVTTFTAFTVQYELYGLDRRAWRLTKNWVDGESFDRYERAIETLGRYMREHANPKVAYKYGLHRVVRRTTTVVDEPLHFPQPDDDAERITLATPLKMLRPKMTARLYNVLRNYTPHTQVGPVLLAHIVVGDEKFWLRQWGMGRKSLAELEALLRDNGLPELGTLPIESEEQQN